MTISSVGRLYFGWISTGMPRPLSRTEQEPSSCRVTSISVHAPASTSSIELSTTSWTSWLRPRASVDPMYIPGRRRTAERPSSTWMELASYTGPFTDCCTIVNLGGNRPKISEPGRRYNAWVTEEN